MGIKSVHSLNSSWLGLGLGSIKNFQGYWNDDMDITYGVMAYWELNGSKVPIILL